MWFRSTSRKGIYKKKASFLKNKKGTIIKIKNNDNLCAVRAVVVGQAYVKYMADRKNKKLYNEYKNITYRTNNFMQDKECKILLKKQG